MAFRGWGSRAPTTSSVGATYRVTNPAALSQLGYTDGTMPAIERAAVQAILANKNPGITGLPLQNAMRAADALRKNGNMPFQIVVHADFTKLQAALLGIAEGTRTTAVSRALNHTLDKIHTWLKRSLTQWVGANQQKSAVNAMRRKYANPGQLEAQILVKDKFPSITAQNFGAVWNRSMPGVQHKAWNRVQIAKGAFMIPGRKPAFRRVGKERFPIVPLFGPNYAREAERHAAEVKTTVEAFMRVDFMPRLRHELERIIEAEKAKHGL